MEYKPISKTDKVVLSGNINIEERYGDDPKAYQCACFCNCNCACFCLCNASEDSRTSESELDKRLITAA